MDRSVSDDSNTFKQKSDSQTRNDDERFESKLSTNYHRDRQNVVIVHLKKQYFPCTECKQKFLLRKLLQNHVKKFHDEKQELQNTKCDQLSQSGSSLQSHLDDTDDGDEIKETDYQCKICERTFPREANLKRHIANTHAEIKPTTFRCNICEKVFERKVYLYHHIKRLHSSKKEARPYQCHLCSTFNASTDRDLRRHIESVHEKLRPFKCGKCKKKFTFKRTLQRHMRHVHEKIKPFECHLCELKCSQRISLQTHIKTVHAKLKPFQCKICEMSFALANNCRIHVRDVHSDWHAIRSKHSKSKNK
jgi:hypothetical protein